MATKRTGISRDLIIHPGETIADILEERNISQAELAKRTGVSSAYISNIIAGKKDISSKFAMALEYALSVPKSFWLNLQANYDAELLELNEINTITPEEEHSYSALHEVIKWLRAVKLIPNNLGKTDTILSLRNFFQVSNISNLGSLVPTGAFRVSKKASIDPIVMGAWLRLCQIIGDNGQDLPQFDCSRTNQLIEDLKGIMLNRQANIQKDLPITMARYGIKFNIVKNFCGAPVQGYISQNQKNEYQMALTIRGAYADIFWFSVFHEIGHIVNGDIVMTSGFIDGLGSDGNTADKETAADTFASNSLLNPESYDTFVNIGDFSMDAISKYADSQHVMPYIVIGRLQKEHHIPYSWYSDYKMRYKWA